MKMCEIDDGNQPPCRAGPRRQPGRADLRRCANRHGDYAQNSLVCETLSGMRNTDRRVGYLFGFGFDSRLGADRDACTLSILTLSAAV